MSKKTYSVSEFKSKSLGLLERVGSHQETFVITKRGKPIAKVIPFYEHVNKPIPGKLEEMLVSENDIVTPFGSKLWKAAE